MDSDYLENIMKHSGTEEMEVVDQELTTQEEYKEARRESRASNLAMELSKERKRLKQELAELQTEVEDLTPTTPTGTLDWYVKWLATVMTVCGIFLISAQLHVFGQVSYLLASCCWVFVGMQWSDRAIMIGSSMTGTAVAMNLVATYVN